MKFAIISDNTRLSWEDGDVPLLTIYGEYSEGQHIEFRLIPEIVKTLTAFYELNEDEEP
jgi:hypothetical protein